MAPRVIKTAPQQHETELRQQGYTLIGGIDEAGRGPLAGPVCSAVVIFDREMDIPGVYDSKALDAPQREQLYEIIMKRAVAVGIGLACAEEIDQINILRATHLAARRALRHARVMPHYLLLDALHLDRITIPQMSLTKGDSRSFSIAAASIIAKVTRDRILAHSHHQYPEYNFQSNKGYATADHRAAIDRHGPTTFHRQTFLQSWFETRPANHSQYYTTTSQQLQTSQCPQEIRSILTTVRTQREWLPITEWNNLLRLCQTRLQNFE